MQTPCQKMRMLTDDLLDRTEEIFGGKLEGTERIDIHITDEPGHFMQVTVTRRSIVVPKEATYHFEVDKKKRKGAETNV